MTGFFRRLYYLAHRRRLEDELATDMEVHREMSAAAGGTPLGNTLLLREEARDAWGWTWIDRFSQDVRYAIRGIRKSPGFTLAAILMLAIGIGANVAAFAFFDLMVLRPLNVRDPSTLLRFHRRSPQAYAFALPYPEAEFIGSNSRTLSALLLVNYTRVAVERVDKQVEAHFVSANYFQELGAGARLGRLIEPAGDGKPGADPVVVLSEGFWERQFGGDPQVVGRTIHVNGKVATVIGVASRDFGGLSMDDPALWAPILQQPYFAAGSKLLTDFSVESPGVQTWGRLRPGATPKAAEDELKLLAGELRSQHPTGIWENESLPSEPGGYAQSLMNGNSRGTGAEVKSKLYPMFALLGTLVLLILAVACANLGSLLLARGVARQREISIRVSVGAGTSRLIRQLFTESLLLAILGSAAGLALGYCILRGLMTLTSAPAWLNVVPDWRVTMFALAVGVASAIFFGLAPAWQIARQRHRSNFVRQILVAAQVAASCVLLIVAGLLGRALDHTMSTNPGFDYDRLISIDSGLSRHGYSPARARAYLDALEARLQALPGVESVSLTLLPPLGRGAISGGVTVNGHDIETQLNRVDSRFFETMKIPLLRGRGLIQGDTGVVVISESLARAAFSGQDPLGKKLDFGSGLTVVGVSGNARLTRLEDSDSVEAYMPIEPGDPPSLHVLVKTAGRPEDLAARVASTARAIDLDVIPDIELVKSRFERKLKGAEYSALAVSLLGGIAHVLACLGIVGVVAYAVSQRTKEIGIRMALGATSAQVLSIVLRQFSRPVVAGMLIGGGAAVALSRTLRGYLYGLSNLDPVAYLATLSLFIVTIMLAALWPARRALRVDPLRALRHE